MSHLSRSEIVDLVDGTLSSSRAAHADACPACREQVETVRAALRDIVAADVPDPSPLFWDHFQARVREGVVNSPRPSAWDWKRLGGFAPIPALLVALLAVGIAVFGGLTRGRWALPGGPPPQSGSGAGIASVALSDQGVTSVLDAGDSDVWAVLTSAAEDVELEAAHDAGMHVYPGTIDRAVQRMSQAELTELGRLLQSELKHSMN